MPKPLADVATLVREARKTLIRAGATHDQVAAFELAILRQVRSHADLGGNASTYTTARITTLEGA